VVAAVALAGFGGDRFVFEGFLPRKGRERAQRLDRLVAEDRPVVLFVSPHRLVEDLEAIGRVTGSDRPIVVTRELTKLHEEVWEGSVGDAIEHWTGRDVKGELTVVIGPGTVEPVSIEDAAGEARKLVAKGATPSEAARRVALSTGVPRRQIYERLLRAQDPS
jgi:16S rRNA (cytidine1402-2'-O)-methyltransferase